jgi:hypothetical protein
METAEKTLIFSHKKSRVKKGKIVLFMGSSKRNWDA